MIKIAKNFGIFVLLSCFASTGFAKIKTSVDDEMSRTNDYDADYYENEGNLTFKVRANGIKSSAKQKNLPNPTSSSPVSVGNFAENGFGADASTTIFFSSNIASEISVGFNALRTKYSSLANVGNNYNANTSVGKRKDIYMVPITLTGQFHIAPYGGIRPYVGLGYHGAYFFSKSKAFKIKNGHGPVLQLGVDFYAKDDTLINFDIRQYFLNTKVTYKPNLVGRRSVSSKVTLNPLMISVGIGFKF